MPKFAGRNVTVTQQPVIGAVGSASGIGLDGHDRAGAGQQDPGCGAAQDQLPDSTTTAQPDDDQVGVHLGGDRLQDLGHVASIADLAQLVVCRHRPDHHQAVH